MGKRKDLIEFDEGQIVMARRLGQSISKTTALVGCSRSAVGLDSGSTETEVSLETPCVKMGRNGKIEENKK
ncbi:hypothetical protein DPX16_16939 [Anabarilius grahami]|uniref:Uncharacterized protein n=1 Tax=Anabarilius grahami TaxID=495550 RepID=A0A3N0YN94_ANAGA|nr:hypothetical protein DPX16_16939 [Anabarilius grahami]